MSFGFKIIVSGDYACFTRPELKVERVSYDVPTPSALEGLLKSVYWKPAIRYVIDEIVVFNPINFMNIRRNEVKEKIPLGKVKSDMKSGESAKGVSIYTSSCRNQRSAMILKDVCYGISFHFEMTGLKSERENYDEKKHYNIIKRRLENGQFFRSPCLGCCEYSVKTLEITDDFDYSLVSDEFADRDIDLGYMLYGLEFEDNSKPINGDWDNPVFSDKAKAVYYRPHLINGVIDVRKWRRETECL